MHDGRYIGISQTLMTISGIGIATRIVATFSITKNRSIYDKRNES